MTHITAGDLSPLVYQTESTYGTPSGIDVLYGEIAEGGTFAYSDTPTPYKAWRYGSRGYSAADYVATQYDAGYQAVMEMRDREGWDAVLTYAVGSASTVASPYGPLPSRTVRTHVRTGPAAWQGRKYIGVKTDTLAVSADAPGAVVKFEETGIASYAVPDDLEAALPVWDDGAPGVQWLGATTIDGTEVYPQAMSITVQNALDRVRTVPDASYDRAHTKAVVEGRREVTVSLDLWMEDLRYVRGAMDNDDPGDVAVTLGHTVVRTVTLKGVRYADGNRASIGQDKQRQTVQLIAGDVVIS